MPAILRKSLTACEAFAALPPTPRMNSRPPRWRRSASRGRHALDRVLVYALQNGESFAQMLGSVGHSHSRFEDSVGDRLDQHKDAGSVRDRPSNPTNGAPRPHPVSETVRNWIPCPP